MTAIVHRVYINDSLRKDLRVMTVTQRAGLTTPATASLSAPDERIGKAALRKWDRVEIQLDVLRNRKTVFTGYVWRRSLMQHPGVCEVAYECVDARILMAAEVVERDFNIIIKQSNRYDSNEHVHPRYVAIKILEYFNKYSGFAFAYDFTAMSSKYNGREYRFEGLTVADALDNLITTNSLYRKARAIVSYISGTTNLRVGIAGAGYGRKSKIIMATKPDSSFKAQPGGRPNVSSVNAESSSFVNRYIIVGDDIQFQTRLALTPAWDESDSEAIQRVMLSKTVYTQPIIHGEANPYYKQGNEYIGRLFKIEKVNLVNPLTGLVKAYQPVIENFLAQNDEENKDPADEVPYPHLIYMELPKALEEEGGEAENTNVIMTKGYAIRQNQFVEFNEPLGRLEVSGGDYVWTFPSKIYLVCTVRDTQRIVYDTGKYGDEPYTSTRRVRRTEYKRSEYRNAVRFNPKTSTIEEVSDSVIASDADYMTQAAVSMLNESDSANANVVVTIPAFTTAYEVGDMVTSNLTTLNNMNIVEVEYICERAGHPVNDIKLTIAGY